MRQHHPRRSHLGGCWWALTSELQLISQHIQNQPTKGCKPSDHQDTHRPPEVPPQHHIEQQGSAQQSLRCQQDTRMAQEHGARFPTAANSTRAVKHRAQHCPIASSTYTQHPSARPGRWARPWHSTQHPGQAPQ